MMYDHKAIEEKWQKIWEERGDNFVDLVNAKKPFYNLMMFPYPSAEGLHVGNMYAFTGADVYGRFMRMRGNDVFEPIGLDGFGIHSENYALKVNKHPLVQAKISEERFYKQLRRIGNIFDWKHTVETYDPDYYRWTQWIFLKLFKAGLVERKKAPVNFCPSCLTVLADEQVIKKIKDQRSKIKNTNQISKIDEGVAVSVCERCETSVESRELEQWFFKITKYAERLLANLDKIDWTEKVKTAQRLWIGKKEGAIIQFSIFNFSLGFVLRHAQDFARDFAAARQFSIKSQFSNFQTDKIEVFTTRPDTLLGATFIVLSPEHELLKEIDNEEVKKYVEEAKKKSSEERINDKRKKTGVFTGLYAINPANNEKIPIWVADYVLKEYGTGAIMGVPGGDERDLEFAKEFNLPVIYDYPEYTGEVKRVTTYHLRDWLVSRQRYWGAPIPMVNCGKCGWVAVEEKDLPVLLPNVADWRPKGTGRGPLAAVESFVHTKCPKCGGEADRETDVCDTFLDSSWYFLRYPSAEDQRSKIKDQKYKLKIKNEELPWDEEITKKWLPVNIYIGGAEHSVLHLMYSRFVTMALHDLGYLDFEEPFTKFYAHGLIIKEGAKMSKSRGNIVNPDEYIEKFGADTLRTYLMFIGPFSEGGDFRNFGVAGVYRFLNRVWDWSNKQISNKQISKSISNNQISNFKLHRLIKDVTEDLEKLRYNTAIAKLMEFLNYALRRQGSGGCALEEVKTYLKLLAPFAPHMTEELYQNISNIKNQRSKIKIKDQKFKNGEFKSIHQEMWPEYDEKAVVEEEVVIVVQVNGKLRSKIKYQRSKMNQEEIEKKAREDERVRKYLEGGVKKTIFVPGKLVNFVTA